MKDKHTLQSKVSVIIPIYNTEQYVGKCLESILLNSYNNLEVICINDGSTDNSLAVLRMYEAIDDRIQVIDMPNNGVSEARNIGLAHATGDFIAFIDSDDWVHKDYFRLLMTHQKQNDADVTACGFVKTTENNYHNKKIRKELIDKHFGIKQALKQPYIKHYIWGRIYKKASIEGIMFPRDISIGEDNIFNYLLFCKKGNITISLISCDLYYYYCREGSAIHKATAFDYYDRCLWYYNQIIVASSERIIQMLLREMIRKMLAARYLTMYSHKKESHDRICRLLEKGIDLVKKIRPFGRCESCGYLMLYKIPLIYRLFRIINDPSMIVWEKTQKRLRECMS